METLAKLGPTIVAGIAAMVGVWKYFYEKNRTIYERRLNEVYAPLYGYLIAQETFRQLFIPDVSVNDVPILTSEKRTINSVLSFGEEGSEFRQEEKTEVGFLDRKNFIRVLNESNKGLARPKLLILIKQYELLVYLEETMEQESEEWRKATNKKVEVELELFYEIVEGYESTIINLGLDGAGDVVDPRRLKEANPKGYSH